PHRRCACSLVGAWRRCRAVAHGDARARAGRPARRPAGEGAPGAGGRLARVARSAGPVRGRAVLRRARRFRARPLPGGGEAAGDARAALEPVLAVADSLPGDRLAPVARQRAGDLYLTKLKDEPSALAQYEECLARYPRAWNSAEVRRRVEMLRRERRF